MFLTICLDDSKFEMTRYFYQQLGYSFESEKHGEHGLTHYSTEISSVPLEIYPSLKNLPAQDRLFIGFIVEDPVTMKSELIERFGGIELELPIPTTKSGIVSLRDPNGILIRLMPNSDYQRA